MHDDLPVAILDIELRSAYEDIPVPPGHDFADALLRWNGSAIARKRFEARRGRVHIGDVWQAAHQILGPALAARLVDSILPGTSLYVGPKLPETSRTVVICTRNRPADLVRCLDSLMVAPSLNLEILVVDNAPSDESTFEAVSRYPVRYIREPRKGLNWARSRGILAASNEIVLFTDDDVVVDAGWSAAMCEPFRNQNVAGVTGVVMPAELVTEAQKMFEQYGGFPRWFTRTIFDSSTLPAVAAGRIGAGASMGVRRSVALKLHLFEAELDCGTEAQSGGDFYAFYQIIRAGYSMVSNPDAICWHRHRRTKSELRSMLYGYSVGVYTVLLRCLLQHGDWGAFRPGLSWFVGHHLPHLWRGVRRDPQVLPVDFTVAEIKGVFAAPRAYFRTKAVEQRTPWPSESACPASQDV